MSRFFGNLFIIGGAIFMLAVSINDTLTFFDDISIINLIIRILISSVIFFILICIARKIINFSYSIESYNFNFMEDLVCDYDIWELLGGCIGISVGLHISIPVLIFVFDIFFGFIDFMKKIS